MNPDLDLPQLPPWQEIALVLLTVAGPCLVLGFLAGVLVSR